MKKHRTSAQWQALVEQQQASGLSAVQFCKQQDIGYASFCNWRKRLLDNQVDESSTSNNTGFLDLSSLMGQSAGNIVLSLGSGVELRLSQQQ